MKISPRSRLLTIAQDLAAGENLDVYVSLVALVVLALLSISGTLATQYSIAGLLLGMGALISLLLGVRVQFRVIACGRGGLVDLR